MDTVQAVFTAAAVIVVMQAICAAAVIYYCKQYRDAQKVFIEASTATLCGEITNKTDKLGQRLGPALQGGLDDYHRHVLLPALSLLSASNSPAPSASCEKCAETERKAREKPEPRPYEPRKPLDPNSDELKKIQRELYGMY